MINILLHFLQHVYLDIIRDYFYSSPLNQRNKQLDILPIYHESIDSLQLRICIYQEYYKYKDIFWGHESSDISFRLDSSFRSIIFCKYLFQLQDELFVDGDCEKSDNWIHIYNSQWNNECMDKSTYLHVVFRTHLGLYIFQGQNIDDHNKYVLIVVLI